MDIVYSIFYFLFGTVFGSFFNVVGLRVPVRQSIIHPPSHCMNCQQRLTAIELIPFISYIGLRGKCRHCRVEISPIYPLFELLTGLVFVHAYLVFGHTAELIIALLFGSLLLIISVSDVAYMLIPNRVLLPFGVTIAILRLFIQTNPWWSSYVGAVVGFLLLLFIALISKGGMGGGDIKLYLIIGLVLGISSTILSLFIASLIGLIYGAILISFREQKKKVPIPFGPAIAIGSWIAYCYGHEVIDWYFLLF